LLGGFHLCFAYKELTTSNNKFDVFIFTIRVIIGHRKPFATCVRTGKCFNGHIDLNLEVCTSNSHVYGTMTLAVTVTVSSGASHLQDNYLVLIVRRNQRPHDFPNGQL
jgi:hypothetical protein